MPSVVWNGVMVTEMVATTPLPQPAGAALGADGGADGWDGGGGPRGVRARFTPLTPRIEVSRKSAPKRYAKGMSRHQKAG
eukprot:225356-Prymnesium_polylepis.1